MLIVNGNVLPSPLVNVIVALDTEPVTKREPVFVVPTLADPVLTVRLNVDPSPLVNVNTLLLTEPVIISEPVLVVAPDPVLTVTVTADPILVAVTPLPTKSKVLAFSVNTVPSLDAVIAKPPPPPPASPDRSRL